MSSRRLRLSLAFALVAAAGTARADDAPLDVARRALAAGVERYDHGDPAAALVHFRAAYAARPGPALRRNLALCLRALGRNAEAMDELDAMLAEGDALDARTRDAAARALEELAPKVARLRVEVGAANDPSSKPQAEVAIDGVVVPPARLAAGPLRVEPGDHVVRARAAGYADAEVRVTLAAGRPDAIVSLELARAREARARVKLVANYPEAEIAIDGVPLARGAWEGALPAGRHVLDVGAPVGRYTTELVVAPGDVRELQVVLTRGGSWSYVPEAPAGRPPLEPAAPALAVPPPYAGDRAEAAPSQGTRGPWSSRLYLSAGASVHAMRASLSPAVAQAGAADRGFVGGSLVARLGASLTPAFQLGAAAELGGVASDGFTAADGSRAHLGALVWSLAPEARVRTRGHTRLLVGLGLGVTGMHLTGTGVARAASSGGIGLLASGELGLQHDLGARGLFGELAFFADVRDLGSVGAARDDVPLFGAPTAARFGLRLAIGHDL